MPNSWFYKLRDMKRPRTPSQKNGQSSRTSKKSANHYYNGSGTTTPKPLPLYPQKSYNYLNAKHMPLEKLCPSTLRLNPKASDIQFLRDHHHQQQQHRLPTSGASAIVYRSDHEFQDLHLRPIRTRPAPNGSTSGTCPSSPRLRSRRLHVAIVGRVSTSSASGRWRSSPARRSFAVVKASTDPPRDFKESMVEMIVENDVHAAEDMQELLDCYLSLNSSEYHSVIMEVFRRICLEIADDIIEDDTM